MRFFAATWLILRKELSIEFRTRELLLSTALFAVLVVVMASISFYVDVTAAEKLAPGVLWIAVTFAGVLAMGRSWNRERDQEVIRGLLAAPIPRASIYLGKATATFAVLSLVEVLLLPLVALFFQLDLLAVGLSVFLMLQLGTLGFVAAGTLFSAMSLRTEARDLMLSVVLFPLVSPSLIAGVVGTRAILSGAPFLEAFDYFEVLIAFFIVFLTLGLWLFEPLMRD